MTRESIETDLGRRKGEVNARPMPLGAAGNKEVAVNILAA